MAPRIARGPHSVSPFSLLLVLLLGLLPSLAGAQVRVWDATYDSGGSDRVGGFGDWSAHLRFTPDSALSTQALAADGAGNSYITGSTNYGIVTVKYNADGVQQWAATYEDGDFDTAGAVAVDATGNVYVAGTTLREVTYPHEAIQPHSLLLKYDPNGNLLWEQVRRIGVWSQGRALAVDAAGNPYLAVQNYSTDDFYFAELLKMSPSGAILGSDTAFHGFDYEEQGPTAVALDASGNAYMAGWIYKPFEVDQTDYFVLRFGGWARNHDSGGQDIAHAVTVDGAGRVFVTGNTGTAAFGPTGTPLWSAPFTGVPHAVAAADGAVWVTGTSAQDFRTARYDAATGAQSWSLTSGGPGGDAAYTLRHLNGVVYVAGTSANGSDNDVLTVGLDATTGAQVWQDRFDDGGNESTVAMTAAGNAFWVAGNADADTVTIRYGLAPSGPAVSALSLSPATFPGGCKSSSGRVTLASPAPAGGTVVLLSTTNPVAVIPASVTVPAGQTRASFPITAPAVSTDQVGTVTATAGGQSRSATLKVRPIGVSSLVLSPNPATGPGAVSGSVLLECAAAPGPITVQLTSSDRTVAWPNAPSIVIPAGAVTGRFTVSTADVAATRWVNIKAAAGGVAKTVVLEVR
jgi:hypothetical protein